MRRFFLVVEGMRRIRNLGRGRNIDKTLRIFRVSKAKKHEMFGVHATDKASGFSDNVFSLALTRGFSNVTPKQNAQSSITSSLGPFSIKSNTVRFLGGSNLNYGKGQVKIHPLSEVNSLAWYAGLIPSKVKQHLGDVNKIFCVESSYLSVFPTLYRFSEFHQGYRGYVDRRLLAVDDQLHRLKLPVDVPGAVFHDIMNAKIVLDTHPGILTRKLANLEWRRLRPKAKNKAFSKGDVLISTVSNLISNGGRISKGHFVNTSGIYCMGSREKICNIEVGENAKSRPVFIPEFVDVLHGSTGLEVFKMYWGKDSLFRSEIGLGHSDMHFRFHRRGELNSKFTHAYEFDGKEGDSSVTAELVNFSFDIYRNCFHDGDGIDNHFRMLRDTMLHKKLVLHNGNTWLLSHGVSSGHAGTANINSMANGVMGTSTIMFCPLVPLEVRNDYELQILGDDICLHTNFLINEETRKGILEWMLFQFNYKGKDGTRVPDKRECHDEDDNAVFLRRFVSKDGTLSIKRSDLWEKILMGPDYSGCKFNRLTYFYRRFPEAPTFCREKLKELAKYFVFIEIWEENKMYGKNFFELFFIGSRGFVLGEDFVLSLFLGLNEVSIKNFEDRTSKGVELMERQHNKMYLTYKGGLEYKDYGGGDKVKTTVSKAIHNLVKEQIIIKQDVYSTMHK